MIKPLKNAYRAIFLNPRLLHSLQTHKSRLLFWKHLGLRSTFYNLKILKNNCRKNWKYTEKIQGNALNVLEFPQLSRWIFLMRNVPPDGPFAPPSFNTTIQQTSPKTQSLATTHEFGTRIIQLVAQMSSQFPKDFL